MSATEARYLRVMRELRARIANGDYEPTGRLPSTVELADEFDFSVGTIRKAIDIMTALGELRGEQGVAVYRVKQDGT